MADKVQIEIVTTADTSGASKAEEAIKNIGRAADKDVDSLKALNEEMAARFAAQKEQINNIGQGGAGAGGGLPIPPVVDVSNLIKGGLQAVQAAYDAIAKAVEHGTQQAIEFNEQLRTLPTEKADELRQRLGPVAELLEANSGAIAEYAKHSQDAERATENFWIALSARAIPSLNALREASGSPELSGLGVKLGNVVGGGAQVATEGLRGVDFILKKTQTSSQDLLETFLRWKFPAIYALTTDLGMLGDAAADAAAKSQAELTAANAETDKLSAAASVQYSIDQARAQAVEAQLPLEERLAAVRERQAALKADAVNGDTKAEAEAASLEKVIVSIEHQIEKQKEADALRKQAQDEANRDLDLRLQLQEATNAGDQKTIDLLKQQIAYRAVLKSSGGDEGRAERAASAEADAQAKRRADAEAKAQADREKGQAATDKKSQQAAYAYEKQKAEIAEKRKELEMETAIN
jgi:hypothetical protein